ncbi:MAG: hypothetical protein ACFFDY_01355 [Candidatus Thorarchaeota archaeon]
MPYIGTIKNSVEDKSQADGAQTVSLTDANGALFHQIQFVPSATPVIAGTMTVSIKTPGSDTYEDMASTIDLINGPYTLQINALLDGVKFTPTGYDAAKTYSLYIASGDNK